MSTKVMGQIWDLDLPHAEAWVLMALADHADHDGANAFPGQDLLAYKTGYSPRQVRRILDALEKKRIIVAEGGGRGRGVTRRYRLLLQNAPKKPDRMSGFSKQKRGQSVQSKEDRMSGNAEQKSGQNVSHKVAALSTFPNSHDTKSGHFEHGKADISSTEKRTFPTQKADISSNGHDKERARVEPSIEPSGEPSIEPSKKKSNSRSAAPSDSASEVFEFWKATLNHPRSILDDKRRKLIRARLDEGFSVEDLQTAIIGCSRSPFHMGQNDRDQVYDDITLICRDAAHVEKFMALATKMSKRTLSAFSPAAQQTIAAATEWLQQAEGQGQ